jgi:hypothetical protein
MAGQLTRAERRFLRIAAELTERLAETGGTSNTGGAVAARSRRGWSVRWPGHDDRLGLRCLADWPA